MVRSGARIVGDRSFRNVLCIVPPYQTNDGPPAGAAALFAYLRAAGCDDFDFLDLRLFVPDAYAPTHSPIGVFGETYVTDIPDLPLALRVVDAHESRRRGPLIGELDELFTRYCLERGINPHYLHHYLTSLDAFLEGACRLLSDAELIGFSTWTSNFLTTLMACSHLKRRRSPPFIVAGGPQVTQSSASTRLGLASGLFDVVVLGEGEATLLEVYQNFRRGSSVQVPGTAVLEGGKVVETERKLLRMSALPTPDFSAMPLALYGFPRKLPYQMSRGCTDECSFCSEWTFWQHFRPDRVEHVIEQVEELVGRYGMQLLEFTDSLVNANLGKLRVFAEELLRRSISITWGGLMRAQMDLETARLLKRSGLVITFVGIESMSDDTLALMNKRRTEAENIEALSALLEAGIFVRAGLIPGYPGDTRERFVKTVQSVVRLQRRFPNTLELNVDPFVVNPGSPVFADLERYGLSSQNFAGDYLAVAPRFLEITSQVVCSVNGPNQGMDRMGALQIVRALTDFPEKVHFGSGLYNSEETIRPTQLLLQPVAPGLTLGRLKTRDARIEGLLLTDEERSEYQRLVSGYEERPYALADDERFRVFWTGIGQKHVLGIDRRRERLHPALYCHEVSDVEEIWIPAEVIARLFDEQLWLVNVLNQASLAIPLAEPAKLEALARAPFTQSALRDLIAEVDAERAPAYVQTMIELGLLQVVRVKAPAARGASLPIAP